MEETLSFKSSVINFYEEKLEKSKSFILLCYHPGGVETTFELVKEAGIGQDSDVLDVASGPGDTAIQLAANLGSNVVGVDLSRKMISYANTLVKGIELDHKVKFVITDAEKLPFKDNVFDAAISECSLCLIPNMLKTLSEMTRVVKPNAKVAVSDIVLMETLPSHLNNFLAYANCIAGAKTLTQYIDDFEKAGLTGIKTLDLSPCVTKQITQFLNGQKTDLEEVINIGETLFSKPMEHINIESFQTLSFYLWLVGKIGYYMISGVKP